MQPDHTTQQTSSTRRRALIAHLANALHVFAQRFLPLADTARDVAAVATRAEELATETWTLSRSRNPDPARVAALQDAFRAFIAEAAEISARAARVAGVIRAVADDIAPHATSLARLAESRQADDLGALRTHLIPLLATLERVPDAIEASSTLAQDIASMGAKAADLGAQALAAQDDRIPAVQRIMALHRSLRAIATESGRVAENLLTDAASLRGGISSLASSTKRIIAPANTATTATARLPQIISDAIASNPSSAIEWRRTPRQPQKRPIGHEPA